MIRPEGFFHVKYDLWVEMEGVPELPAGRLTFLSAAEGKGGRADFKKEKAERRTHRPEVKRRRYSHLHGFM